jgi:molecular chaperone IbpA
MATLDFAPLFRSTVGFDKLPTVLMHAMQSEETGYPPYNIEKLSDDGYRIVMAVAGFGNDDIDVVTERNRLIVRGELKQKDDRSYLHRGIAARTFERSFDLADFVQVTGATLRDGLLMIDLKRELPEEMKPRKIAIQTKQATVGPKTIEHAAA